MQKRPWDCFGSPSFLALPINLPLSGAQHKGLGALGRWALLSQPVVNFCQAAEQHKYRRKAKQLSLKLCSLLKMHSPAAGRCQPCCFLLSAASSQPTFILNLCLLLLPLKEITHYLTPPNSPIVSNTYGAVFFIFVSFLAKFRPLESYKNLSCSLVSSAQLSPFPGIESSCFLLPRRFLQAHSCQ